MNQTLHAVTSEINHSPENKEKREEGNHLMPSYADTGTAVPLIAGAVPSNMYYYLFSKAQIHSIFCHVFREYSSLLPQYFLP